jgi:clan AA aspartic protease (TIGR02281 family)
MIFNNSRLSKSQFMIKSSFLLLSLLFISFIPCNSQTKIPLQKVGSLYYIPCKVNGLNMKFIFDSGASNVTISLTEALFMLKNDYLTEQNIIGTNKFSIANGEIMEGTRIILNSIIIGGIELRNVETSIVHTPNAPLLLGQSALSKLGKYNFDYFNNTLTVFGGNSTNNTSTNNSSNGCITGNCLNGQGTYTFENGQKYVGEFKDGKKNEQGTYTWPTGDKYVGQWLNDERYGQGTQTWPTGDKYVGQWLNDERYGQGTQTLATGEKYVGEFKDGKFNGYGIYTWPNGNKYVGDFLDDVKQGTGTLTSPGNYVYVGQFANNLINGNGTMNFSDGSKYSGEFKDGTPHGNGTLLNSEMKYVGGFKNGLRHGYGNATMLKNGTFAIVQFDNGVLIDVKFK